MDANNSHAYGDDGQDLPTIGDTAMDDSTDYLIEGTAILPYAYGPVLPTSADASLPPIGDSAMDDLLEHLTDGNSVALPYAYAGHLPPTSAEASPLVSEFLGAAKVRHPFRPDSPLQLLRLRDGSTLAVTVDRMAHVGGCERCTAAWDEYASRMVDLPEGWMASARFLIDNEDGSVTGVLVDAEDVPDEMFE